MAEHLELAGRTAEAITYLRRAAEQAARQYAHAEAAAAYSRALQLWTLASTQAAGQADLSLRYDLLLGRQSAYGALGDRLAQAGDLDSLYETAETLGDPLRLAQAALSQLQYYDIIDELPTVVQMAPTALALARAAADIPTQAGVHLQWGRALWPQGQLEAARTQLERALALAGQAGLLQMQADSLRNLGNVCVNRGNLDEAHRFYQQALDKHRQIGDRRGEAAALNNLGYAATDLVYRLDYLEQALATARQIGDRPLEGTLLRNLGQAAWTQRRVDEARQYLAQSLEIAAEIQSRSLEGSGLAVQCEMDWALGEYEAAMRANARRIEVARQGGLRVQEVACMVQSLAFARLLGDSRAARTAYGELLGLLETTEHAAQKASLYCALAQFENQVGSLNFALERSQQAVHSLGEQRDLYLRSQALLQLGLAQTALGDFTAAETTLQQALQTARPQAAGGDEIISSAALSIQQIEVHAALASLAQQQGQPAQALSQVDALLELAHAAPPGIPYLFELSADPFSIYLAAWRVLQANDDPRAPGLLAAAQALLLARAQKLSNPDLRHSFVHTVPANRILGEQPYEAKSP